MDMKTVDDITGMFQFGASIFILMNIRSLIKSKRMLGISIFTIIFYNIWDLWGIYMFYRIGNTVSMWTAIVISCVYVTWSLLVFYYNFIHRKEHSHENSVSKREEVHICKDDGG